MLYQAIKASLVAAGLLMMPSMPAVAQSLAPPPQIPYGLSIDLDMAKKAAHGASAEPKKNKWNMAIAVVDTAGVITHGVG